MSLAPFWSGPPSHLGCFSSLFVRSPVPTNYSSVNDSGFLPTLDAVMGYDDIDPSLADGYTIFYEREVPTEVRSAEDSGEVGSIEAIRFKVLILGPPEAPSSVRVGICVAWYSVAAA